MNRFVYLLLFMAWGTLQAQDPSPAQLLLVETPGSAPEIVRAAALEQRGQVVLYLGEDGSRNAVQVDYIVGNVPLPNTSPANWSQEEWAQVKAKLQATTAAHPKFAALGQQQLNQLESAARNAERNSATQEWQQLQKKRYEPATSRAEAVQVLEKASALTERLPAKAAVIRAWMQPWQEHLQQMEAGNVWRDGRWQTQTVESAETETAETVAAEDSDALAVNRQVFSWLPMLGALLGIVGVTLLLGLIAFAGLRAIGRQAFGSKPITSGKQGRAERAKPKQNLLATAFFTLLVIGVLALEGYFLVQLIQGPSTIAQWEGPAESADDLALETIRQAVAEDASGPLSQLQISAATANRALDESPLWEAPETANPLAMKRTGWALELTPDAWVAAEQMEWLGRPFLITYRIPSGSSGGRVVIQCNGQPLPPWLASKLWHSFHDEVTRLVAQLRAERNLEVAIQKDQTIRVRPVAKPKTDSASLSAAG